MADLAPITVEGAAPANGLPPGVSERAIPTEDQGHVALTDPDGTVQSVPIANAERAVKQYGYRPSSDVEYYTAKTGTLGTVAAGVAGAGRGLSLGAFDPITIEAERALHGDKEAEEMRRTLNLLKQGHETASTVGEIGGSLATLAFGLPPGEAAAVTGETMLARAGARALQAAPRLFAEGAAMDMGHQLSEDTLGNHELTAGKYLASGLEGGLLNVILGAGLVAGGGALVDKLAARGGRAIEAAATTGAKAEAKAGGGLAGKLSGFAEEQAAKGAMPSASLNASEMQKLGRTAEEQAARVRRIGRTLLDEGITTPLASKGVQAERLTAKVKEVGEELGSIRKGLEKAAARPSVTNIMEAIEAEVMAPLRSKPFSWAEQASVAPYLEEIQKATAGKSEFGKFSDLFDLRSALDKKLDPKLWQKVPGTAPAGFEELGKIRGILESEFERAADVATKELGEDLATRYATTKAKFSDLKTAEKWATKAAARDAQNRAISLTDTIMGGAAIASGHGVLGILAPVGNKLVRTYGNQAAAVTLDRIAKLEALQAASAAFDKRLDGSVRAFFKAGPPPETAAKSRKITPAERQALRAAVQNPRVLTERVADHVAATGLTQAAPNVARALTGQIMRAATLVQQKLPREPSPVGFSFGQKEARELGPRQQAQMDRALSALDVDKTLDDLAHGQLSREQVEAIKIVNPPLFGAIQGALRRYGMDNDPTVSIQQEMALAIAFDTPVSTYTRGATIRGFQQAFAQGAPPDPAQAGGPKPTPIGNGESKAARSLASPTDRMEASDAL